jgi:hypothetical protein
MLASSSSTQMITNAGMLGRFVQLAGRVHQHMVFGENSLCIAAALCSAFYSVFVMSSAIGSGSGSGSGSAQLPEALPKQTSLIQRRKPDAGQPFSTPK